jgi:hypothetical protein
VSDTKDWTSVIAARAVVDWYYRTSPPIADVIAADGALCAMTRLALTALVLAIKYPAAVFLLLLGAIGLRRRSAR